MGERTWPSSGAQLEGHPRAQLLTSSLCWPPLPGATCTGTASSECRGKTASGEMDNSPTRPVLPRLHHCPASHGALPPRHQPWGVTTSLPAMGHCHPATSCGTLSPHCQPGRFCSWSAHSNSTNRSRGQVEQGDKVTEGAQQGTNSLTKSGWDIPELHMPRSHQGAWACAAPCDPSRRESPREKKCSFVPSASRATPCPPTQPP